MWSSFTTILAISTAVSATNCNGAWQCDQGQPDAIMLIQNQTQQIIDQVGPSHMFQGGQIACSPSTGGLWQGSICAFYQQGGSGTAQDVYNELGQLMDAGCDICGSVSTDPGILTVNYVQDACCQGDCVCWNTVFG